MKLHETGSPASQNVRKPLIGLQQTLCTVQCMATDTHIQKPPRVQATTPALAYSPGVNPEPCTIHQSTSEGACVRALSELPDVFILRHINSRVERLCRVIWREDDLVGVEYFNMRLGPPERSAHRYDWETITLFPT